MTALGGGFGELSFLEILLLLKRESRMIGRTAELLCKCMGDGLRDYKVENVGRPFSAEGNTMFAAF